MDSPETIGKVIKHPPNSLLAYFFLFFLTIVLLFNFSVRSDQQFSYLAESFLAGKTYFLQLPDVSWHDASPFHGNYYWPLGPFPAVLLAPFMLVSQWVGEFFFQGYLQFLLIIATIIVLFHLAARLGFSSHDSWYWAFAFCFSSVYLGIALMPISWFFAHAVATLLLLTALLEWLGRKRYWVIGALCGLLLATRAPAAIGGLFFVLDIITSPGVVWQQKKKFLILLVIPVLISAIFLGIYNHARFDNYFEQGYSMQVADELFVKTRSYGLFHPMHIPGNLYYFLLSPPLPIYQDPMLPILKAPFVRANPWGMSIFLTSPYLLTLFFLSYRDRISKIFLVTIVSIAIPIFLYYGIGFKQMGYRYALDFFPFLFLLFIKNYPQRFPTISQGMRVVILLSALANLFFFFTLYFLR